VFSVILEGLGGVLQTERKRERESVLLCSFEIHNASRFCGTKMDEGAEKERRRVGCLSSRSCREDGAEEGVRRD